MKGITTILFLCATLSSFGQTAVVSGVVTDNTTGEPLPFTHVFFSGTTIVGVTDENGQYALRDVPYGSYQLIASFVGYHQYSYNLTVNKPEMKLGLRLVPLVQDLQDVVVAAREDKEWNRNLKAFKKYFLGQTQNAKRCEIANPWVIDFEKKGNQLSARAPEPIEVVNQSTGYKIFFYLQQFVASPTEYSIIGPVRFESMNDEALNESWQANRLKAFHGSQQHFLQSLYTKTSAETGFKMYVPINALAEEERSLSFERDLGTRIKASTPEDLVRDLPNGVKGLIANKPVEVHFEGGQDHEPLYKDILHQVSWIQSRTGYVRFNAGGNILNPQDVTVVGYWNRLRVGDMLPLNYKPEGTATPEAPEPEKLQIITDRMSYHPGDMVWYSVVVSGQSTNGTGLGVHVGLLDSTNNVVGRRLDPVESRRTSGQFKLPEHEGTYFLAAFTASSYARGEMFMKPILVVPDGKAASCDNATDNIGFTMRIAADTDSTNLAVMVRDGDNDMINGNFVIAVSPGQQHCACLDQKEVKFAADADVTIDEGIARGTVTNKKGKPLEGRLMFFTDDLSFSIEKTLTTGGRFELADLVSYDSTNWLVQLVDEKNKPVSDFNITWDKSSQAVSIPPLTWKVDCEVTLVPEVALEFAKPQVAGITFADSVRVLKEVTVSARKVKETERPAFRTFGQPQYVVKGSDVMGNPAGVNVFNTLNGRIPGLRMNETVTSWTGNTTSTQIRGSTALGKAASEPPLVIVDGVTYDNFSLAMDLLQMIPMSDVDRIEVRTGISPLVGVKRANGIIAVYTKRTGEYLLKTPGNTAAAAPNPFIKNVVLHGYSTPGEFAPAQSTGTLHWNHQALFLNDEPYRFKVDKQFDGEVYVTIAGFSPAGDFIHIREKLKLP